MYQLFVSVGSFETARGASVAGPARGAARRMQMYATDSQSGCQNCSSHSASFLAPSFTSLIRKRTKLTCTVQETGAGQELELDGSWAGAGQELGRSWATQGLSWHSQEGGSAVQR